MRLGDAGDERRGRCRRRPSGGRRARPSAQLLDRRHQRLGRVVVAGGEQHHAVALRRVDAVPRARLRRDRRLRGGRRGRVDEARAERADGGGHRACGCDQSSPEPQPVTSAAVAASMATARSGGRKAVVLSSGGGRCASSFLSQFWPPAPRTSCWAACLPAVRRRAGCCSPAPCNVHWPTEGVACQPRVRRTVIVAAVGIAAAVIAVSERRTRPSAHGFSSTVYVDVTAGDDGSRPHGAGARIRPPRRVRRRLRARRPALPGGHRRVRGR